MKNLIFTVLLVLIAFVATAQSFDRVVYQTRPTDKFVTTSITTEEYGSAVRGQINRKGTLMKGTFLVHFNYPTADFKSVGYIPSIEAWRVTVIFFQGDLVIALNEEEFNNYTELLEYAASTVGVKIEY